MNEKREPSKITKVILNDLQGRKRIIGHDFEAKKIRPYIENKNENSEKPQKKKKLSTSVISVICATSISLIGIGAYSYNKIQDRKKLSEMLNQAEQLRNKTINFYRNDTKSFTGSISKDNKKTRSYKRKNTS